MDGLDFDHLAIENSAALELEYAQSKAKPKIPKPPPLPKPPKPTAAVIKETRKFLKEKEKDETLTERVAGLRKIELYKVHFAHKLNKKYSKLSIKNDLEEIESQLVEIEADIAGNNSIPLTKMAFVEGLKIFEHITTHIYPIWLNTQGVTKAVCEPGTWKMHFEDHLTMIAIKHDLFSTGPKTSLLMNFVQILGTTHIANTHGTNMQKEVPINVVDNDRYADL